MTKTKSVFKKRAFRGNKHIKVIVQQCSNPSETSDSVTSNQNIDRPRLTPPSASRKKLSLDSEGDDHYGDFKGSSRNFIVNIVAMESLIENLRCKKCGGVVNIEEVECERNGLASKFCVTCSSCHHDFSVWTSDKCTGRPKVFETNIRLFYGLRCIGRGLDSGKVLCALLNLPPPSTARGKYTDLLSESIETIAKSSMAAAAKEAVESSLNEPNTDLSIAFDGSWQKRGFKSKNGYATITNLDTGKVLDTEVLTKFCSGCSKLPQKDNVKKVQHETNCVKNYEGASGGMEGVGAVTMFNRSVAEKGVRYVEMLGDGDSKAFERVKSAQPYGPSFDIQKIECVGHVEKRMGTRLRNLKQKMKGIKLSDDKPLGGAHRLTDKRIDQLQSYYGKAIRGNSGDLEGMRRAVWATFCHSRSTDEKPEHRLCPVGPNSWCKYNNAKHEGTLSSFQHNNSLPEPVAEAIRPIYKALVAPDLLRKCLHGKTQNVNESFNNVVWTRVPKGTFVGKKTLEIGVWDSVLTFNDGNKGRLRTLQQLGVRDLGKFTVRALLRLDLERLRKAEKAAEDMSKDARVKKRRQMLAEEEGLNEDYCPGGF